MNELTTFTHEQFGDVRIVQDDSGQTWFVATDVCKALGIINVPDALKRLESDEKMTIGLTDSHSGQRGGAQSISVISESGLYAITLTSRKPEARAFKRWVTHDILPAIKRHGFYATEQTVQSMLQDPDTMITLLQNFKSERAARLAAEARIAQDAPKVLFADSVSESGDSILVGDLAKLLHQNGVDIGRDRLYDRLRSEGYIMKGTTAPTQKAMNLGLFRVVERTIINPDGSVRIVSTTRVTGKGQRYFIDRYLPTAQYSFPV